MNLIYKVENIKLGRCADMIETDNHKLMSVLPLPDKYLKSKYIGFRMKFDEFLFDSDVTSYLADEWSKIIFYHKARNVLPLLFEGIKYSNRKVFITYYEKFYGKFTTREAALEVINNAIKNLNKRIGELNTNNEDEPERFSLWDLVLGVEFLLGYSIDRNINLSTFKRYMKKASKHGRKN